MSGITEAGARLLLEQRKKERYIKLQPRRCPFCKYNQIDLAEHLRISHGWR